jgi:hypothetical protein
MIPVPGLTASGATSRAPTRELQTVMLLASRPTAMASPAALCGGAQGGSGSRTHCRRISVRNHGRGNRHGIGDGVKMAITGTPWEQRRKDLPNVPFVLAALDAPILPEPPSETRSPPVLGKAHVYVQQVHCVLLGPQNSAFLARGPAERVVCFLWLAHIGAVEQCLAQGKMSG